MAKFSNQLTDGQTERFALLAEEMGEAIQVIGKILRHGLRSYNPHDKAQTSNRQLLEKELGDVLYACTLLCESNDLDWLVIDDWREAKADRVIPYLHHQEVR